MLALAQHQRRHLLRRAILTYRDAEVGVRPMAGVCERHIPIVRLAIAKARHWEGLTPQPDVIIEERLNAASQQLEAARQLAEHGSGGVEASSSGRFLTAPTADAYDTLKTLLDACDDQLVEATSP